MYVNKPKAIYGALINTGVGLLGNVLSSNKANRFQQEAENRASRLLNNQKQIQDKQVLDNFDTQGQYVDSFYMKNGGKMPSSYLAKGGDLIPVSSDSEEAVGNKHNESTIDNTSGIKLYNQQNQPIAEVEDEEIIKDGQYVYSDVLKPEGSKYTFAEEAKKLATKKGKKEENLKNATRLQRNTLEREIESLDYKENMLFKNQEEMKNKNNIDNKYVSSKEFKKGGYLQDGGYTYGGGDFGQKVAPYIDNAANLISTLTKPRIPKPSLTPLQSFNTEVNVNDRLSNVDNEVNKISNFVQNNTSNSNTARANIIGTRLKGTEQKNRILAQKENQERQLENQAIGQQQRVAFANNRLIDQNNQQNLNRSLAISKELTQNVANAVNDYGANVRYNDSIQLEKEKNELYRNIYAGNNSNLKLRTILDNPSAINRLKSQGQFDSFIRENLKRDDLDESTRKELEALLGFKTSNFVRPDSATRTSTFGTIAS